MWHLLVVVFRAIAAFSRLLFMYIPARNFLMNYNDYELLYLEEGRV